MLPAGMGTGWLPQMFGMGASVAPWLLLAFAAALALGLFTRLVALLLLAVISANQPALFGSGQANWLVVLNFPRPCENRPEHVCERRTPRGSLPLLRLGAGLSAVALSVIPVLAAIALALTLARRRAGR